MEAQAILAELRSHVEEVGVAGDRIRWRPANRVPVELVEEIQRHKPELLQLLTTPTLADALQGVELAQVSLLAEDVLMMPLKEFAESRLLLEVYSQALQERVLFAGDRAHVDAGRCRELTLYRGSELLELCGVDAPNLRVIHDAKKVFGGQVVT